MSEVQPYIWTTRHGEKVALPNPEYEKIRAQKYYDILLKMSGIPPEYYDYSFEVFQDNIKVSKENLQRCIRYAQNPEDPRTQGMSLFLHGKNASGKSTIACAIGMEFIRHGKMVRFIQAGELVTLMWESLSWNVEDDTRRKLLAFHDADLIIIDDAFDSSKALMWKTESRNQIVQLWDNFFRRHITHQSRFIVTSNVEVDEISAQYSHSLYDLIDRNFVRLDFKDNVKIAKKKRFEGVLDVLPTSG